MKGNNVKIVSKTISRCLALVIAITILTSCSVSVIAQTAEYYNVVYPRLCGYAQEIETLSVQCENNNITTDYERASYAIMQRFLQYMSDDAVNGTYVDLEYITNSLEEIYKVTKNDLTAYLNGTKEPKVASKYITDDVSISGKCFSGSVQTKGVTEEKPIFLTGLCGWDLVRRDTDFLSDIGLNLIQTNIKMGDVIADGDPVDDWEVIRTMDSPTVISQDNTTVNDAVYSLKITDSTQTWVLNQYTLVHQKVTVLPNTTYHYGLSAKRSYVTNTWFSIKGKNGTYKKSLNANYTDTVWQNYDYTYTTGDNETELDFTIITECSAGALYIDSAFVKREGTNDNLLINPSFENRTSTSEYRIIQSSIDDLKSSLAGAEANNVLVDVLISTHNAPALVLGLHPELAYSGYGFFRYNPLLEKSKEIITTYVDALIPAIKDYRSLNSICLTNEPSFITAYEPNTYNPLWQSYLSDLYDGDISKLNAVYQTAYGSFSEIDISQININKYNTCTPMYYDWKNFNDRTFGDWHAWLAAEIKRIAPNVRVHSKAIDYIGGPDIARWRSQTYNGINHEIFAEFSDLNGCDTVTNLLILCSPLNRQWHGMIYRVQ